MITSEDLKKANEGLKTIDFKGKGYVEVNTRVKAFRNICPSGSITTEIVSLENGVVTMKATITDEEGRILSTGLAQEKESSSYINKTSFIENCETSAIGRALGFLAIGVDGSICSTDELANALNNQGEKKMNDSLKEKINDKDLQILKNTLKANQVKAVLEQLGKKDLSELTNKEYGEVMRSVNREK